MAKRIQLQRTKGWRMPAGAVKVDRSTRWGNPFVVERARGHKWTKNWQVRHGALVIHSKVSHLEALNWSLVRFAAEVAVLLDLEPLRGKDLACWCKPGEPCHADVLLELANQ